MKAVFAAPASGHVAADSYDTEKLYELLDSRFEHESRGLLAGHRFPLYPPEDFVLNRPLFPSLTRLPRTMLAIATLTVACSLASCKQENSSSISGAETSSIVQAHGFLTTQGNQIVDQGGQPVQLRGMSLFWSNWAGQFWNAGVTKTLVKDWKITLVRAAMAVEFEGGYLASPGPNKEMVKRMVQSAVDAGIYVIIDWHAHEAHHSQDRSIEFFSEMAKLYGNTPNVIFEIFNEPKDNVSWDQVRNYANAVVKAIRGAGANNLILVGTLRWSQDVDIAAAQPVDGSNVAYVLHFYATSHKQWLRDKANSALGKGVALFVTEFGTCEATGDGALDEGEADRWMAWMAEKKISWANWSVNDKAESCSALAPGAGANGGWRDDQLTQSGKYIKRKLAEGAARDGTPVAQVANPQPGPAPATPTQPSPQITSPGTGSTTTQVPPCAPTPPTTSTPATQADAPPSSDDQKASDADGTRVEGGYTFAIKTTSSWGSGSCKSVDVTNTGSSSTPWALKISLQGKLTQSWNTTAREEGGSWVFAPGSFNGSLAPGGRADFGFCVSH